MSRYNLWINAHSKIAKYIRNNSGIEVNKHNFYVENSIFNNYCKKYKIIGSFSTRILLVNNNLNQLYEYVKQLNLGNLNQVK